MATKWIIDDSPGMDIWSKKTEIEPTKRFIAMVRFNEYWMFFGDTKATEKERSVAEKEYIDKEVSSVTFDDFCDFTCGMFGNSKDRTITIIDGDKTEKYKPTHSSQNNK